MKYGVGTERSLYEKLCCTGAGNVVVVVTDIVYLFFRRPLQHLASLATTVFARQD